MSMQPPDDVNPYQPPRAKFKPAEDEGVDYRSHATTLKKFNEQMIALGALWIIFGAIATGIGVLLMYGSTAIPGLNAPPQGANPEQVRMGLNIIVGILLGGGLLQVILGILTCMKIMPAVYVGLVLTSLSLLGQLNAFNLCSLVVSLLVIFQAIRVIGWARQLKAAGVPLDARY